MTQSLPLFTQQPAAIEDLVLLHGTGAAHHPYVARRRVQHQQRQPSVVEQREQQRGGGKNEPAPAQGD